MTRSFFAALVGAIAIVVGGGPSSAQMAYIANSGDNTVSVIDTSTNTVVGAPIPVGTQHTQPTGVAVSPDGSKAYVTGSDTVSVISVATNTVVATIPIGARGVAVSPDSSKVYVTGDGTVSVIDAATNTVSATIPVGGSP